MKDSGGLGGGGEGYIGRGALLVFLHRVRTLERTCLHRVNQQLAGAREEGRAGEGGVGVGGL